MTSIGEASIDLVPGDSAQLIIDLTISETKIIIPDAENHRIVQIDDMTGTGWVEKNWKDYNFTNTLQFYPYDIDFDSQGRVYIANNNGDEGRVEGVIRIDDINDTVFDTIVDNQRIKTIAIDRENDYIYYSDGWSPIYRKKLNPLGSEESFTITNEPGIGNFATDGMAADQNGYIFIANTMNQNVIKYDPSQPEGSRISKTYTYGGLSSPWDVLVRGDYLYVADTSNSETNTPIVRFSIDNPAVYTGYGSFTSSKGTIPGEFYGPHLFVAILNKKLYITDNDMINRKLVEMDDIIGAGWNIYGNTGSSDDPTAVGHFKFYSNC